MFLTGIYKGSIVGFYNKGASIITYTILGVPYYACSYNIRQNPSLAIKGPYIEGSLWGLGAMVGFRGVGFIGIMVGFGI